jgi:hypothetical protein
MSAIDAEMVFIAEGRNRQIDARPPLFVRFGFGVFERPACVAVLLAQLGGLVSPRRLDWRISTLNIST